MPATALAFTADRGWHLTTVDRDRIEACDREGEDELLAALAEVARLRAELERVRPTPRRRLHVA